MDTFFNFLEGNKTTQDSAFHDALVVCLFLQVLSDITFCPWVCVSRLSEEELCVDSSMVRDEALRVFNTPGIANPKTECNITNDLNYHEQSGSISHLLFSY
jgi:hypothetical protein